MTSQHSVELNSRALGTGHPVVALHGSASSGAAWRSLVGYLEGRFRVHTPDLPGYGASPPGAGGLAGDARAVAGLIERIGAAGAPGRLLLGRRGGAEARGLAARGGAEPDGHRAVRLPPAPRRQRRPTGGSSRRSWRSGRRWTRRRGRPGVRRRCAFSSTTGTATAPGRARSPRLRDFFLRCHDRIRAEFRAVACEAGGLGDLGRIACPTLAVMGLESPTPSLRVTELVARAVPGAVLRIVPDAGHMLPLTDPHVVDPMIGRHLAAAQPAVARLSVGRGVKGMDGWAGTVRGRPRVGQSAERRRVTRAEDIAAFTAMTGDRNPLHYDGELAAASVFGRIIVQGGVTSGLLNALVAEDLPAPERSSSPSSGSSCKAVGIGEELAARAEVLTVREDKPICTLATSIRDGAGDVCLEGTRDHLHGRAQSAGRLIAVVPRTRSAMLWR